MSNFNLCRITKVSKGDWLQLPSGRFIEVCKIVGENRPEVHVRHLDSDGVKATGSFILSLAFLLAHGRRLA